jgi:SepF-like predicted cell division protein (DUF552 family)
MGFFDKLFGKKEDGPESNPKKIGAMQLTKTAEMLDEDLYWRIIVNSLQSTNNQDDQEQFLIKEISNLSPKEMIGFRLRTDKLLHNT